MDAPKAFTEADFAGWRFTKDAVHFNGGAAFFGYGHRCVDQPRLLVIDKYFKKERSTKRSYLVDGRTACETLDQALAALSTAPTVDDVDRALLRLLKADEWTIPESRSAYMPLAEMGFVEWGRNDANFLVCRLTAAGSLAIAAEAA